jgi:SOS response regulatory protein OraA/RecX
MQEQGKTEIERIADLLLKKYVNKLENGEDAEKVIAALARKGFRFSDIRDAVRMINSGEI